MNAPSELVPLNVSVTHPSKDTLDRGPAAALQLVNDFIVDSAITFEIAAEELQSIKSKLDALDTQRKGITRPLDEAKKAVMDLYRGPVDALEQAERILKSKMLAYQQEEARKAEALRLDAERKAKEERDRLEAEAKKLEQEGRGGEAVVTRTVAEMVVAQPVQVAPPPAAKGISTSTTIDHELESIAKLIAFIVTGNGDAQIAHPELVGLVVGDSVKLRNYVKGLGMACNLPGVRVFQKQTMSARKS